MPPNSMSGHNDIVILRNLYDIIDILTKWSEYSPLEWYNFTVVTPVVDDARFGFVRSDSSQWKQQQTSYNVHFVDYVITLGLS